MNWITKQIGNAAGSIEYYFGGGTALQSQNNAFDAQLNQLNQQDYVSGGQVYNTIAAVN